MCVVVSLFIGLVVSAEEIFRDRKILKREKYLQLSRSSYLFSKVGVLFLISAIQTVSFILVGNLILELPATELKYWVILFSTSCFANMLGLNISSAFDSAVTIYILIPILVIPQLLLSGVVITFDKFNPKVGNPKGIPAVAETMASRWAFEAFIVSQFMSNPYEEKFYPVDQKRHNAEYMTQYYLPELETQLSYLFNNKSRWRDKNNTQIVHAFDLLKSELSHQVTIIGGDRFPEIDRIEVGKFNDSIYSKAKHFIDILKKVNENRRQEANQARDTIVNQLSDPKNSSLNAAQLKLEFQNEAVNELVEDALNPIKIIEWNSALVRKFQPIYIDEFRPRHALDFRAGFYIPKKHLMGSYVDTFYFNIMAIWFMTTLFFFTLYYDLLKKVVQGFELRRKYSRKAKVFG